MTEHTCEAVARAALKQMTICGGSRQTTDPVLVADLAHARETCRACTARHAVLSAEYAARSIRERELATGTAGPVLA